MSKMLEGEKLCATHTPKMSEMHASQPQIGQVSPKLLSDWRILRTHSILPSPKSFPTATSELLTQTATDARFTVNSFACDAAEVCILHF